MKYITHETQCPLNKGLCKLDDCPFCEFVDVKKMGCLIQQALKKYVESE